MNGYRLIKAPSGRYIFVGRVPAALAFRGSASDIANAIQSGPRIAGMIAAREGRIFESLSWVTEDEANAYADMHVFNFDKQGL